MYSRLSSKYDTLFSLSKLSTLLHYADVNARMSHMHLITPSLWDLRVEVIAASYTYLGRIGLSPNDIQIRVPVDALVSSQLSCLTGFVRK